MPDINMQVFEDAKRNQLITEVDIQTQAALDDYQVSLSDIANPMQSQDNVVIDRFGEFLPHWNESLDFDTWVKMSMEVAGKRILILRGNSSVGNASDGDATFLEFDNDANAIASEWATVGGTWDAVSDGGNTVRRRTNGAAVFGSESTAGTISTISYDDFIIDTKVKHDSSAITPFWTGIQFRYTDNSNRYWAYIQDNGYVYLDIDAGHIASYNGGYAEAAWHDISVTCVGTTIKVSVNGVERINTTDSSESTGKLGYFNYNLADNELNNKYDNFRVRKYAANKPTWIINGEQNIAVALKSLGRAG